MGLFDFLKKKKAPKPKIPDIDLSKVKVPKEKLYTMKVTSEQIQAFTNDRDKNDKLLKTLPKDQFPSLGGKIVGYSPHPQDFLSKFFAVVEYPIIGKPQQTFVVNCTALIKLTTIGKISYPAEGTWIMFKNLGEQKDTDGELRSYGIATIVFSQSLFKAMMSLGKKKK